MLNFCLLFSSLQNPPQVFDWVQIKRQTWHWFTFTLFFFRNPKVALNVCLGSLSWWKSAHWPGALSDGDDLLFQFRPIHLWNHDVINAPHQQDSHRPTLGHWDSLSSLLALCTFLCITHLCDTIQFWGHQLSSVHSSSLHLCHHGPWWSLSRSFCVWALGEASSVDGIYAAIPLQCTAYCAM